jgi:hypothetical protein
VRGARALREVTSLGRARAAAACGLAAAAWAFLVPSVAGCAIPSYSHVSQFISELGASGAPHGSLVSVAGFVVTGLLVLGFLGLARGVLPGRRLAATGAACLSLVGVAYLVSAAFPCDPGCPSAGSSAQAIHNLFGLLEYLGAVSGLLLLAAAFRADAGWRRPAAASAIAATLVVLGFAGMLLPALEAVRGISQRVAEASIFGWVAYLSVLLLRGDLPLAATGEADS